MSSRGLRLVALAVTGVLGFGLAACSSSADPAAITVNGHVYSQSSVQRELDAIAGSEELAPFITKKDGSVTRSVAATWLTGLVEARVAAEEVRRENLDVTKSDRRIARQRAGQVFGRDSIYAAFPVWFQRILRERYALSAAVVRANGTPPTDEQVRAQYDASVTESCASHRFISHILVATEEEAQAVLDALTSGADFGRIAAQASTDTTSGRAGGDLGCLDGQTLDPAFSAAANALPIGGTSAPVESQFGWHIIRARDIYDAVPFEQVREGITNDLATSDPEGRRALVRLMAESKVKVHPRYGRWVVGEDTAAVKPPGKRKPAESPGEPGTDASSTTTSSTP